MNVPKLYPEEKEGLDYSLEGTDEDMSSLEGVVISDTEELSVVKTKSKLWRRKKPQRTDISKTSCEYYNEEANLEDGDLPSLRVANKATPTKSGSDRDSRPPTPQLDNTTSSKLKELAEKARKNSRKSKKKARRDGYGADSSDEYVQHPAQRLSPDSKRKHRVFWSQLDENDDDSSGDDGPDDELAFHRTNSMKEHDMKRKIEIIEDVEQEDGGGIMEVITDLCTDCAWLTGGSTQTGNQVAQQHDRQSSFNMRPRRKGRSMGDDIDDDSSTESWLDDQSIQSQSVNKDTKKSAHLRRKLAATDVDENTAIEIEYMESKEDKHNSESSGNTAKRNNIATEAMKKETREGFLQLDPRGEVSVFTRPNNLPKKSSEAISDAGPPQAHSEKGGYIMERSQTWSSPEKNAYLQAMALKAKEDFRRRKGLDREDLQHIDSNKKNAAGNHHSNKEFTESSDNLDDSDFDDDTDSRSSEEEFDLSKYDWTPAEKRRFVQLIHSNASITRDQAIKVIQTSRNNASARKFNEKDGERRISVPLKNGSEEALNMRRARSTPSPHLETPSKSSGVIFPASISDTFHINGPITEAFDSKDQAGKSFPQTSSDVSPTGVSDFPSTPTSNLNKSVDAIIDNNRVERTARGSIESHSPHDMKRTRSTPIRVTSLLTGMRKKGGFSKVENSEIHNLGRHKSKKSGTIWHQINDDGVSDEEQGVNFIHQRDFPTDAKDDNDNDSVFDVEGTNEAAPIMSLKLDPYHDSCDVSMLGSIVSGGVTEGGSIVSGRSMFSSATNATSSTRKRHRGAAKKRIPKKNDQFQESGEKPNGWLDSIKAVAAANNRKWDPKHGWLDYVEPAKATESIEVVQIGRLRPPGLTKHEGKDRIAESMLNSGEDGAQSTVPFPSTWKSEREEMVKIFKDDDGNASAVTEVVSNKNRTPRGTKKNIFEAKSTTLLEQQSQEKSPTKKEVAIKTTNESNVPLIPDEEVIENSNEGRQVHSDQGSKPKVTDDVESIDRKSLYEWIDDTEPTTGVFCAFPTIRKDVGTMLNRQGQSVPSRSRNAKDSYMEESGKDDDVSNSIPAPLGKITKAKEYLRTHQEENSTTMETEQILSHKIPVSGGGSFEEQQGRGDSIENEEVGDGDNYNSGSFENQSFDFSTESSVRSNIVKDNDPSFNDDGFKVIEGTKDMSSFVVTKNASRGKAERLKTIPASPLSPSVMEHQAKVITPSPESKKDSLRFIGNDETSAFGDRSTRSVNSFMSAKAKAWMNKIDSMKDIPSTKEHKKNKGVQSPETRRRKRDMLKKQEDSQRALFVSAVDENSTFEMAPKTVPKGGDSIFDMDFEDETLFEFREQDKDAAKRSNNPKGAISSRKHNLMKTEISRPVAKSNFLETTKNSRKARNTKRKSRGRPGSDTSLVVDDSFSEITTPSDVSSGRPNDPTFLSRLNACTAPIIDSVDETFDRGEGVPQAHLDFLLQKSPTCLPSPDTSQEKPSLMNILTGPNFCGNTNTLDEDEVSPSLSKLRGSVASTYLDAIKKKEPSFSGSKSIASASSSKSETWQKFLDKRQKSLSSNRSQTSDVSEAAEQYAAKKVSDIINKISNDSGKTAGNVSSNNATTARPEGSKLSVNRPRSVGRQRSAGAGPVRRSAAAKAAEDLAAARVEAMMSAMSTSKFEEGEI